MKIKIWMTKVWNDDFHFEIKRVNNVNGAVIDVQTIKRGMPPNMETDAEFEQRAISEFDDYVEKAKTLNRPEPQIVKSVEFE